jgi:hypothetical protein
MYLVKALSAVVANVNPGVKVDWQANQIRQVENEDILYYNIHTDVFSVLAGPYTSASENINGSMAAAYIDFNAAGEAGMTITIDGVVYTEADTAVAASGIFTNGASAATSAASLIAAINGDTRAAVPFTAVADISGDGVWLFWDDIGSSGNVTIETDSEANCTVQDSAGGAPEATHNSISLVHVVNAQELLSGGVEIPLPFTPTGFHLTATDTDGNPVYCTDIVTIEASPARIRITTTGATNLADTDIVYLTAFN